MVAHRALVITLIQHLLGASIGFRVPETPIAVQRRLVLGLALPLLLLSLLNLINLAAWSSSSMAAAGAQWMDWPWGWSGLGSICWPLDCPEA